MTQEADEEEGRVDSSPPAKGLPVGAAEESEIVQVRQAPQAVPSAGAHDGAHDFCEHVRAAIPAEGEAHALDEARARVTCRCWAEIECEVLSKFRRDRERMITVFEIGGKHPIPRACEVLQNFERIVLARCGPHERVQVAEVDNYPPAPPLLFDQVAR